MEALETKENTYYSPTVNGQSIYILMNRKGRRYFAWETPQKAERRKYWEPVRFATRKKAEEAEEAYPNFKI